MSDLGNKKIMARNIQRLMALNNKTRQDVCKDLGFKYTTFTSWYNGDIYPRIDKIEMMANYFGVSKSELVEDQTGADLNGQTNIKRVGFKQTDKTYNEVLALFREYANSKVPREVQIKETFSLESLLLTKFRQLNFKGQEKVFLFALDLAKDPAYQSEELINETKEMFQKYIKAGLLKEASSDDN